MTAAPDNGGNGEVRPELAELRERKALLGDEARPEAVAKRRATGRRTARENLADLVDADSFVEYGGLAIAAQRARREVQELIERTPADGLIGGTARINGAEFRDAAACAVISYDYMVLAGTQGVFGHRKKDRLFELIERMRLPTVIFAEGGGGRPAIPTTRSSRRSTRVPSPSGRGSPDSLRGSRSSPGAASPATPSSPAART